VNVDKCGDAIGSVPQKQPIHNGSPVYQICDIMSELVMGWVHPWVGWVGLGADLIA